MIMRTVLGSSRVARYAMGLCNNRVTHSRSARSPALSATVYQTVCSQPTSARVSFCTAVSANRNDEVQEGEHFWSREVKLAMQQQEQAEGVLELIQQAGLTPDNNFFVALIREFGAAKQPEQAEAVLELMRQAGVAPDSSTFAHLVYAWRTAKQPERAEAVLELMQQAGVAPDSSTFAHLIKAWGTAKQPEQAEWMLELMRQAGVVPDNSTFKSLIQS